MNNTIKMLKPEEYLMMIYQNLPKMINNDSPTFKRELFGYVENNELKVEFVNRNIMKNPNVTYFYWIESIRQSSNLGTGPLIKSFYKKHSNKYEKISLEEFKKMPKSFFNLLINDIKSMIKIVPYVDKAKPFNIIYHEDNTVSITLPLTNATVRHPLVKSIRQGLKGSINGHLMTDVIKYYTSNSTLNGVIDFDSELSMFCIYCNYKDIKTVILELNKITKNIITNGCSDVVKELEHNNQLSFII